MERRNFLSTALLSIPVISFANLNLDFPIIANKSKKGFVIKANESRYFGKTGVNPDFLSDCKISTSDSDNGLLIFNSNKNTFKEKGGPPLHVHSYENEIVFVISGNFEVHIEDKIHSLQTGDTAFIPKGTMHTISSPIDNNPGQIMCIFQPASEKVEQFFEYVSRTGQVPLDKIPEGW